MCELELVSTRNVLGAAEHQTGSVLGGRLALDGGRSDIGWGRSGLKERRGDCDRTLRVDVHGVGGDGGDGSGGRSLDGRDGSGCLRLRSVCRKSRSPSQRESSAERQQEQANHAPSSIFLPVTPQTKHLLPPAFLHTAHLGNTNFLLLLYSIFSLGGRGTSDTGSGAWIHSPVRSSWMISSVRGGGG